MSAVLDTQVEPYAKGAINKEQFAAVIDHSIDLFKPWALQAMGLIAMESKPSNE